VPEQREDVEHASASKSLGSAESPDLAARERRLEWVESRSQPDDIIANLNLPINLPPASPQASRRFVPDAGGLRRQRHHSEGHFFSGGLR
jgi:hypothetical protein